MESALRDANTLKRPWAPYTLFMQTAGVNIAANLGLHQKDKGVEAEGKKRWEEMNEEDKKLCGWTCILLALCITLPDFIRIRAFGGERDAWLRI